MSTGQQTPQPGTPEWIEQRRTAIGASEIAAACGLSPWEQSVELWQEKVGERVPRPDSRLTRFGRYIEPVIVQMFEDEHGIKVIYPMDTVRHPDVPYLVATPDAAISDDEGLEAKSMSRWRARQVEQHGVAEVIPEYVLQAQAQMAVMGWKVVRLVALVERDLQEWSIERNERLIENMIRRAGEFWGYVERREPPPVDFTRDDALRVVEALYPTVGDGVVRLSNDAGVAWEAYEKMGRKAREMESERKKFKAGVLAEIGEACAGLLPDGRMVRRSVVKRKGYTVEPSEYIDVRAVKYDGSPIMDAPSLLQMEDGGDEREESPEPSLATMDQVEARLRMAGFLRYTVSDSGSRYFIHDRCATRVRVSDHAPNDATREWMERADVRSIRLDKGSPTAQLNSIIRTVTEPAALAASTPGEDD